MGFVFHFHFSILILSLSLSQFFSGKKVSVFFWLVEKSLEYFANSELQDEMAECQEQ